MQKNSHLPRGELSSPVDILDSFSQDTGAPNENMVQNHLNIALLNVF